jgi:hypothetical protein
MPSLHRIVLFLGCATLVAAQSSSPDLTQFADASAWTAHNRTASAVPDRPGAVRLDARQGDGALWLANSDFAEGVIEFDVRGADRPGQSFVGVAFRGADSETYNSVYFRPFNFKNPDPVRAARAVQYVSMPAWPWPRLREEHPGKYEATVNPVPDPNGWFHVRIVVEGRSIKAFVNGAAEPSLTVTELSERRGGRIGLWVGNGSSGDFANLKITPRTASVVNAAAEPIAAPSSGNASAAYFGLTPPETTPELFAPGIINIPGRSVGRIAFSPDATECAFTVFESIYANNRILYTRFENGAWTPRTPVLDVDGRETLEPLFSRDNRRLYFAVKTPGDPPNVDLWETQRTAGGWSKPRPLPPPFNSAWNEFCLTQTVDGTMYFASGREGGHGGLDLYRTVVNPGQPLQVENLGTSVNSATDEGDPALSPDGQVLVFYSASNRPRASGNSDLFICFANGKGGWTRPVSMGEDFNTPAAEYATTFSQDGRVLFFTRFDGKKADVYWVSTAALERFRQQSAAADGLSEPSVELPPERKPVHVPPEILRRYVGTYVMEGRPEVKNHITLEANQLMTAIGGQPKFPLFAESETRFFLKVAEAEVEFLKNDREEATALVVHQNGLKINMAREEETGPGAP